jgi:hypothetical protein
MEIKYQCGLHDYLEAGTLTVEGRQHTTRFSRASLFRWELSVSIN